MVPMETVNSECESRDLRSPLHRDEAGRLTAALEAQDLQEVESILCQCSALVNCTFGRLHSTLVQLICMLPTEKVIPFLKVVISHGANVSLSDKLGCTPLHFTCIIGDFSIADFLVRSGADVNARYGVRSTPDIKPITGNSQLLGLLGFIPLPECWGRTPLHQAVKGSHTPIVKLLLENGADVNAVDEHGTTPILLAGAGITTNTMKRYEDIINLLIQHNADVNVYCSYTGTTTLHHSTALNCFNATQKLLEAGAEIREGSCGQNPFHEAAGRGAANILSLLLEYDRSLLNEPDTDSRTALHKAAFAGSRECVFLLLKYGADLSAETKSKQTVIDIIFSHVPRPMHLFNDVFDSKITCNEKSINEADFKVTLDFSIFLPQSKRTQMSVVGAITQSANDYKSIKIIQHPLIEAYLHLKWNSLRIFFYIWILTHLIFTLSLSTYIMLIIHHPEGLSMVIYGSRIILLISSSGLLIHAILQCLLIPRHYFKQYELWMNLICITLSVVIAVVGENIPDSTDFTFSDPENKYTPVTWVLHASSVAILLVWVELMFLIGRFPSYGYYALMFSTVLQNVVKVLLTFLCLVVGFALSFAVQFHMDEQFQNPWRALVKTSVMMMGEFEYNDLFQNQTETNNKFRLPGTSRIVFTAFIVVASIVLMNLLVGLAVNDIQGLHVEGHVRRLAKQSTFLSHIERLLLHNRLNPKYFPSWIYKYVYYNRAINDRLVIRPAQAYVHKYTENSKQQKIPQALIEALVKIALENKKSNFDDEEIVDSKALQMIMAKLLSMQQQLTELQTKNNA